MLLTFSASSFQGRLGKPDAPEDLLRVPSFVRERVELHGLNVPTSMLAGWTEAEIDRLRDSADKAGCPCLLLVEDQSHEIGKKGEGASEAATTRLARVLRVGHRLGCSGVVIKLSDKGDEQTADRVAESLKVLMAQAERSELNLLMMPSGPLTGEPTGLTGMIRKVGGFRIGSFPDFAVAAEQGDASEYLRALTPYAGDVLATIGDFDEGGHRGGYDFDTMFETIRAVGYDGRFSLAYQGKGDPIPALQAASERVAALIEAAAS
ncbi:MAG: TIM barrel protein [Planctomycetota bacterium]